LSKLVFAQGYLFESQLLEELLFHADFVSFHSSSEEFSK